MSIYEVQVKEVNGNAKSMSEYKDKVLLIVNTATGCGFTPQYEGLQKLYDEFEKEDLEILDFPCNQFGHQAPGSNEEIVEFCQLKYNTTFETFAKIDVNGKDEAPLYTFLKSAQGGLFNKAIKWNFTKFLVGKDGEVLNRYASTVKPEDIREDIIQALKIDVK